MNRNSATARTATIAALLAGAALAGLPGCSGKKKDSTGHAKAVSAANDRYNAIRSRLILDMAQQHFDAGNLDQAEASLRDALAMDADNPKLHMLAGRICLERGQLERAFRLFELSAEFEAKRLDLEKKPENKKLRRPEPFYYQGVVLQRWQQFDKAEAAYGTAYELAPDNVAYLLAKTEMMVETDRIDGAIAELEAKQTYFDQNAALRAAIGHLYRMKGQPAKAVPYFEQAVLLAPDNAKLAEELALTQLAAGNNEKALLALEKLVADPARAQRIDLRRALATAYIRTGRDAKARDALLAVARSPQGEAADWVKVGELSLKASDAGAALNAAQRAIAMAPQRHEGYLLAGMVLQKRGQLDESLRMFDRAAELSPADAAPLIMRGISLERAGRKTAAADAYREALRRNPGDARAQKLLGNVD